MPQNNPPNKTSPWKFRLEPQDPRLCVGVRIPKPKEEHNNSKGGVQLDGEKKNRQIFHCNLYKLYALCADHTLKLISATREKSHWNLLDAHPKCDQMTHTYALSQFEVAGNTRRKKRTGDSGAESCCPTESRRFRTST